ncbi:hypothetical protein CRG98_030900 [Punica granatum]|uniref:Uncharacterized protein n=1 Tax=Punica granatum TaxID=22663 RepID=A0A2I0IY48_PUNGR|nr:hypothetical protein CRG98_030900 [Punica granatum]
MADYYADSSPDAEARQQPHGLSMELLYFPDEDVRDEKENGYCRWHMVLFSWIKSAQLVGPWVAARSGLSRSIGCPSNTVLSSCSIEQPGQPISDYE